MATKENKPNQKTSGLLFLLMNIFNLGLTVQILLFHRLQNLKSLIWFKES
jgi:hypothetical protein